MTRRWQDDDVENLPPNIREQVKRGQAPIPPDLYGSGPVKAEKKPRASRIEQELQIAIVTLADQLAFPQPLYERHRFLMPPVKVGDYLHHTPNGGGRSAAEGGIFKAMGVRAGYPDLTLDLAIVDFTAEIFWPGWRCELKVGDERPRANQILWIERLERAGFYCTVARSVDEWQHQLLQYLVIGDPFMRPRF